MWAERCIVNGIGAGGRGTIYAAVRLQNVPGLILSDGQVQAHNDWDLHIYIPLHYPYSKPEIRFQGNAIPFSPHVLHKASRLDEQTLPRELLAYLEAIRDGQEGWMCYAADWSPLATHDLTLLLWQVSRILGGRVFGEMYSLNNEARDYYLRLGREGSLPLGSPLPLFCAYDAQDSPIEGIAGDDDAVELTEVKEE